MWLYIYITQQYEGNPLVTFQWTYHLFAPLNKCFVSHIAWHTNFSKKQNKMSKFLTCSLSWLPLSQKLWILLSATEAHLIRQYRTKKTSRTRIFPSLFQRFLSLKIMYHVLTQLTSKSPSYWNDSLIIHSYIINLH